MIANQWLQIPEAEMTLVALSPAIFFVAISSVMRGYFNGRQNIKATAKSQTIEQIFKTALTIILVEIVAIVSNVSTEWMAGGATLATTLATMSGFTYLYLFYQTKKREIGREINSTVNYKYERVKTIIKRVILVSAPIALTAILSSINKNIDSFTVVRSLKQFMPEDMAIAQYGILGGKVDTLTSLPLSINVAFSTALVPAISAAKARKDKKTITQKTSFSLLIAMLIGLPCTVGMCIFAGPILELLFPNASMGTEVLQITSLTIIFTILDQTINGALQGYGKLRVPAISLGCRCNIKTYIKFSFSSNTFNRSKWSSLVISGMPCSSIFNSIYSITKMYKIKFNIFKICIKTSNCNYYHGDMFILYVFNIFRFYGSKTCNFDSNRYSNSDICFSNCCIKSI